MTRYAIFLALFSLVAGTSVGIALFLWIHSFF